MKGRYKKETAREYPADVLRHRGIYLDAIRSYDDLEDFIALCNASIEDWNAYARRRI